MGVLLVVRGRKHEKCTPEDSTEAVERVCATLKAFSPLSYLPCSSARIFFGRGAVMAKALGTTVEEEHKLGLHKIAQVRLVFCPASSPCLSCVKANKRSSRHHVHQLTARRSHCLVRRLPPTRLCPFRQPCNTNIHSSLWPRYATTFHAAGTISS